MTSERLWTIIGQIVTVAVILFTMAYNYGQISQQLQEHSNTLNEVKTHLSSVDDKIDTIRDQQVKTDTELKLRQHDEFAPADENGYSGHSKKQQ